MVNDCTGKNKIRRFFSTMLHLTLYNLAVPFLLSFIGGRHVYPSLYSDSHKKQLLQNGTHKQHMYCKRNDQLAT